MIIIIIIIIIIIKIIIMIMIMIIFLKVISTLHITKSNAVSFKEQYNPYILITYTTIVEGRNLFKLSDIWQPVHLILLFFIFGLGESFMITIICAFFRRSHDKYFTKRAVIRTHAKRLNYNSSSRSSDILSFLRILQKKAKKVLRSKS